MIKKFLGYAFEALRAVFSYQARAKALAVIVPRSLWFVTAYRLSQLQDWLVLRIRGHPNLNAPKSLSTWLGELTQFGGFAIPQRVRGAAVLALPGAKLICVPHTVYFEMAMHAAVANMRVLPWAVVASCRIEADGRCQVTGLESRLIGISADGNTLVRMKRLFEARNSVLCLADTYRGKELNSNPMKLAGRMGARIVFVDCDLASDGTFEVDIADAPVPFVKTEKDLQANVSRLLEQQARDVDRYGAPA